MLSANQIVGFYKMCISRKKWLIKFTFSMQINIEAFYKLILSFWMCATRRAEVHNIKICISLQYSQKSMGGGGEADFLPATKYKNYGIILDLRSQACPKYPKQ